ncbi:MAG: lipocalin-like domain-containing protein [Hyphomicrobiaceae bacterium]
MTFERIRNLIGTWRLIATSAVDDAGQPIPAPYGPIPHGIVVFGFDGRMLAVLADGRPELSTAEVAREFNSYCGNFTFDGETLITVVDGSSNPGWIGAEQVRTVRFDGERLVLKNGKRTLTWERVA